jgi:hypothetical protein
MIKLVSGETLLAEIINDGEWELRINNPIAITIKVLHAPILMSHMWMPFDDLDNLFSIRHEHIITTKEVDKDMISYYNNCIEAIHENMTSEETFLIGAKKPEKEESVVDKIKDIVDQIEERAGFSANTTIH